MKSFQLVLIITLVLCSTSCQSWFHPQTKQEKNALGVEMNTPGEDHVMGLRFGGLGLESQPTELNKFTQVKKISSSQNGYTVYQVYNPNPNVSMMIGWYLTNQMKQMELRYLDAPGINTLSNSGGWQGIQTYLTDKLGPPSMEGTNVPITATQDGLSPTNATFNGVWIFSGVNRQLNYLAYTNMAFINLKEINPYSKKKWVVKNQKEKPSPTPENNPGISTPSTF
jgi:hypothetical protein